MELNEAIEVNEAISRGEGCPSCKAEWNRPAPPQAWTLEHAPDCDYRAFLDAQED